MLASVLLVTSGIDMALCLSLFLCKYDIGVRGYSDSMILLVDVSNEIGGKQCSAFLWNSSV